MSRFNECGFDVVRVDLVQHAFNQAFGGVFGSAVWTETRYSESTSCTAEYEVAAVLLCAEIGQRKLEDVEGPDEVGFELVAELLFVLVFASRDHSCSDCKPNPVYMWCLSVIP